MNRRMSPEHVRLFWSVMKLKDQAQQAWWDGLKAGLILSLVPLLMMAALVLDPSEVTRTRDAVVDSVLALFV